MRIVLFLISLCFMTNLFSMEKDLQEKKEAEKPKKSSALEKAALKVSVIAKKNNHTGVAKFFAKKLGDKGSPTNVVHQATLTKNPDKREALFEKAAMLDPKRPSTAKEYAAKRKYDAALNKAHAHLSNIIRFLNQNNPKDAEASHELYKEELENINRYYKELCRCILLDSNKDDSNKHVDESALDEEVVLNNLEVHYTWELELVQSLVDECTQLYTVNREVKQKNAVVYFEEAKRHFIDWMVLKEPDLSQDEMETKIAEKFSELEDALDEVMEASAQDKKTSNSSEIEEKLERKISAGDNSQSIEKAKEMKDVTNPEKYEKGSTEKEPGIDPEEKKIETKKSRKSSGTKRTESAHVADSDPDEIAESKRKRKGSTSKKGDSSLEKKADIIEEKK